MSIYQEYVFREYPNSWKECKFYEYLKLIKFYF